MSNLKNCPYCGSVAEMHTRYDSLENIAYKKSEIPKTARLICEKKYPHRAKYYIFSKKLYIPRCTVTNCMGRTSKGFELEKDAEAAWNRRADK